MEDEELTKLAVAQLISEGEKFRKRRELTYTFDEPARKRPNLRYFKNTLKHCLSSNDRVEKVTKSNASRKLQILDSECDENRGKALKVGLSSGNEGSSVRRISRREFDKKQKAVKIEPSSADAGSSFKDVPGPIEISSSCSSTSSDESVVDVKVKTFSRKNPSSGVRRPRVRRISRRELEKKQKAVKIEPSSGDAGSSFKDVPGPIEISSSYSSTSSDESFADVKVKTFSRKNPSSRVRRPRVRRISRRGDDKEETVVKTKLSSDDEGPSFKNVPLCNEISLSISSSSSNESLDGKMFRKNSSYSDAGSQVSRKLHVKGMRKKERL